MNGDILGASSDRTANKASNASRIAPYRALQPDYSRRLTASSIEWSTLLTPPLTTVASSEKYSRLSLGRSCISGSEIGPIGLDQRSLY